VGGKSKKVTSTLPPWKRAEKWKLVMRISGGDTFGYSSSYWTNDKLLNENGALTATWKSGLCRNKQGGKWNSGAHGGWCYKSSTTKKQCQDACENYGACRAAGHYGACDLFTGYTSAPRDCPTGFAAKNPSGKPDNRAQYYAAEYGTTYKGPKFMCMAKEAFDAKYPAFTKVPFSKIKMCIGSKDKNCVEHKFTRDYANAKALFAAGYLRDKTVDQKGILKAFGPAKDSYQSCPMQRPGFNIQCNDGNKARWGYCTNCQSQPCQNADSNDADASIGIGLAGQSTPRQMGAGWTNYFASGKGTCSANSMTEKKVWFYVYENTML